MTTSLHTLEAAGRRTIVRVVMLVAGLLTLMTAHARAGAAAISLQEYSAKAVLLFNFAKYTDWSPTAFAQPDDPIIIGVLGDDPFGLVLDRIVQGRSINGRPVVIRRASGIAPLEGAHLVFVSASQPQAPQDCAALEQAGVLTVGDSEFTSRYTAVSFAMEADKLVFTVDLDRSARTGAAISSHLLKFAKAVKRARKMDV